MTTSVTMIDSEKKELDDLKNIIGPSPMSNFIPILVFVSGYYGIAFALFLLPSSRDLQGVGLFLMMLGFIIGMFLFPYLLGKLILTITTSSKYKNIIKEVRAGRLMPSYIGRNYLLASYVVVDLNQKLLFINGNYFDFSKIKKISTYSENKNKILEIIVSQSTNPVHKIVFDFENELNNFFYRICEDLGLEY